MHRLLAFSDGYDRWSRKSYTVLVKQSVREEKKVNDSLQNIYYYADARNHKNHKNIRFIGVLL
jgi:hypothetical protein